MEAKFFYNIFQLFNGNREKERKKLVGREKEKETSNYIVIDN